MALDARGMREWGGFKLERIGFVAQIDDLKRGLPQLKFTTDLLCTVTF